MAEVTFIKKVIPGQVCVSILLLVDIYDIC